MAARNATAALAAALSLPQLVDQPNLADIRPGPTPWGSVAAVLLCLLPVFFLLATTLIKPIMLPSSTALPLSAALLALIRLTYLSSPPLLVLAHTVVGALEGLVPLAVIFGAILLFEVMAATGCLQFMMANVRCLSAGCPIAEVFLIGWAFAYTISGVGGFSTPMALATPMLVSLGHDPLMSLVTVVGLNGLSAHLGSVGMAVWYGFKSLNLSHTAILHIGLKSAVVVGACSFVIAPAAASFLVPWRDLLCNASFVLLSIGSAVVPTVLFALFSPEFPLVAGGLISMLVTWLLVKYGIGLKPPCTQNTPADIETDVNPAVSDPAAATAAPAGDTPTTNTKVVAVEPLPAAAEVTDAATAAAGAASLRSCCGSPPVSLAANGCATLETSATDSHGSSCGNSSSSASGAYSRNSSSGAPIAANSADARLVSPFEVYCQLPLPGNVPTNNHTQKQGTPATTKACVTQQDVIARRSSSLLAAAAAVGGFVVQQPSSPIRGPADDVSTCIFRCHSCAADQRDLLAAETAAALHRQLSAPASAVRAAAAAAAWKEGIAGKQRQPVLLPALSVVNHATGEHIMISGLDKLTGALRVLLHPGGALSAYAPFKLGPALLHIALGHHEAPPLLPAWQGPPQGHDGTVRVMEAVLRMLPIWLTLVLLLITHVPALKLQDLLRSTTPSFTIHLGTLGQFSLSPALVLQLKEIFTHGSANWTAELLHIPCLVPFVVVSCVTLAIFRRELKEAAVGWHQPFATAWGKISGTVSTMLGALVLAQLMSAGGAGSPAFIVAYYLTSWMGKGYLAIAGFLGALGSFVSGSVMGSNMTQGAIQAVAADRLGVPMTSLLAVQVAGACAGKMVCISSILSAKVVVSELHGVSESEVIRRTAPLALLFVILAQVLGLAWTLGGLWPDAP